MYSQARYQQEEYYDEKGGYRQPRGDYNTQLSNPYGYEDDENYRSQYHPRRPPPRTHDEYDNPPESYQESYYDHDYEHLKRAQRLRRDTSYDHSREYQIPRYYRDGYGEDYHDQEDYYYEHRRDRRNVSHQRYKSQSYPSNHYDDDEDYRPQRGSTNSQSYDSYPSQAYSPQSYIPNTPPSKRKSIAEHMYEHWLEPKPRDPNDSYKTIEEHMFENMKLQVICHACKGPHYRYQCQKYLFCKKCKAKFSCECKGKHRREDEVDQRCNAKSQGKYGLSEETWALARRLGINIVPDDSMEEDIRVTPRVDQCVHNDRKQISLEVPLEEVIEEVKESEQEVPVSEELQDQEKGNPDGGYGSEFENAKNEEELPFGETFEAHCGKILHSSCVNNTLGNNCAKSWADMCDDDDCEDIGVPICVDNRNVDNVDDGVEEIVDMTRDINCTIEDVENAFVESSSDEIGVKKHDDLCDDSYIDSCDDESLALVDNSLTSKHDSDMHEIFYFDDENNVDDSLFEANKVEFSDFFDTYLDDALFVHDMIDEVVNDEGSEYENVEEKESVEGKEKIEKEERENEKHEIMVEEVEKEEGKEDLGKKKETKEESVGVKIEEKMKNDEVEFKEKRKDKEKKKVEENSILLDMDSCQPLEESVLCVDLKEFVDVRHLRAYLEERVDGETRLVPVQVCLNEGSKVASGQGR